MALIKDEQENHSMSDTQNQHKQSRTPIKGTEIITGGNLPIFTYLVLALYLIVGIVPLLAIFVTHKRWKRWICQKPIPLHKIQLTI